MVLKIDVKEKPTGAFTFGGGYSSVEDFFIMGSISQRNLFGKGQVLQLRAELGGRSTRYILSFTEPWLFNRPLSAGFDLYDWDRDYDDYQKHSIGANLRIGYPVWDYTRAYLTYTYDRSDITTKSLKTRPTRSRNWQARTWRAAFPAPCGMTPGTRSSIRPRVPTTA